MDSVEQLGSTPWAHTSHLHVLPCPLVYSALSSTVQSSPGSSLHRLRPLGKWPSPATWRNWPPCGSCCVSSWLLLCIQGSMCWSSAVPAKGSFWQRVDGLQIGNLSGPVHFISLRLVPLCQLSEQGQRTPMSHVCFGLQLWLTPLPGCNGSQVSCELVPSTSTDNSPT